MLNRSGAIGVAAENVKGFAAVALYAVENDMLNKPSIFHNRHRVLNCFSCVQYAVETCRDFGDLGLDLI